MNNSGKLLIALVVVGAVVGIAGAVGLTAFWVQRAGEIEAEAYAQWLQFFLTTGVGSAASLIAVAEGVMMSAVATVDAGSAASTDSVAGV